MIPDRTEAKSAHTEKIAMRQRGVRIDERETSGAIDFDAAL
jgi:hypothetical protein